MLKITTHIYSQKRENGEKHERENEKKNLAIVKILSLFIF
jgi:hypothetical protein